MAVEFPINVYGLTRQYERIKIASAVIIADANPVGGTIFYIDDTADGVYEFYDTGGNIIENIQVGDKPCAYKVVTPGTKDKYYVYHDEIYDNLRWTYYKDGAYVYESLGASGDGIGTGKTNTEIAMTKDNGAYVTADSDGLPTIWYQLQQTRLAKAGGCDDWFVPSSGEAEKLKLAVNLGNVIGGAIAGSSYDTSVFKSNTLWSSSELISSSAWAWLAHRQGWYDTSKLDLYSVFFIRAF